jgi:hypothetical protein
MSNIENEAIRIVEAGQAQGVTLRLLGGLAVRMHAPSATLPALARAYADFDLATSSRARAVEAVFAGLGYTPEQQFNLLQGDTRLLFHDPSGERQVDVFVGAFEMCHKLPLTERLTLEPLTLPLAELLLTKLQIVQINDKDLRDVCALLLDHPPGAGDDETINTARMARLCAEDWGLWRTVTGNLDRTADFVERLGLAPEQRSTIRERAASIRHALDAAPKPMKWRMRAKIGDKVRWYELPEEVGRG